MLQMALFTFLLEELAQESDNDQFIWVTAAAAAAAVSIVYRYHIFFIHFLLPHGT